ncbi:LysR family transcriptional regulator [Methylobacterium brachythecii]|nr:LysR family transcriptional regulator [Methylobacterium brachythecii]
MTNIIRESNELLFFPLRNAIMLDLVSVRLFVLALDLGSLTRAAEAAGTVQPVVSQRLKALEATLGRKLLDRSPRFVRATEDGRAFLEKARLLLRSHDEAMRFTEAPAVRFSLGFSDHALGLGIEPVLQAVRSALPGNAIIDVRMGLSQDLRPRFDAGQLDAIVIRRESGGREGEVLGNDHLGWRAAQGWSRSADGPLPLATLGMPCGVHEAAIRLLDRARIPWRESFQASSCAALCAGVRSGLGVALLGDAACDGMPDAGPALGLPPIPASEIVMFGRAGSPIVGDALRALELAIRKRLR